MQTAYPGWCDPNSCRATDTDIQHRSTPTLLSTNSHEWRFTLTRIDQCTHVPKQVA